MEGKNLITNEGGIVFVATASIIGIIGGLILFSGNITGAVIGNQSTTNWIGAGLLVIGLVAGFFWMKGKKKAKKTSVKKTASKKRKRR